MSLSSKLLTQTTPARRFAAAFNAVSMSWLHTAVDPGYDKPALSFLVLATVVQIVSMTYLSALIFAGTFPAETFRRRRRLCAAGTSIAGVAFLGFGLKLATASLG